MSPEFPYQLATFLNKEPTIGEPVYGGKNGWFAQIALKRRFKIVGISEQELIAKIEQFCTLEQVMHIKTGKLVQLERMPVQTIEVQSAPELMAFHRDFIAFMGNSIISRYPERDGAHYLPHITAEYNDQMVIDIDTFTDKDFVIRKIFLLKDARDPTNSKDSVAYHSFSLS